SIEHSGLTEAISYIDEYFTDPLNIDYLAGIANYDRFGFIRRFKRLKGITPGQYIILKRVQHARKLLRNGNSISDAVYLAGFYDQSHLSRNFKKMTGLTPKAYLTACNSVQD
ncbi:MAG: AraC family transcriptional regulator, partial [Bacteroidota bacterium]